MNNRIEKLRAKLVEENIDNFLITDPYAIFYLIGKWYDPEERLLILNISREGKVILYLNKLFPAPKFDLEIKSFIDTDNPIKLILEDLKGSVGLDKNMPAKFLLPIMDGHKADYKIASKLIDDLRAVKDEEEIEKMFKASEVNDKAMAMMKEKLKEGLKESEMAEYLLEVYKSMGSNEFSFEPIVAYGANGADPHHSTDDSLPKEGDSIVVDMGCMLDDYASDMTRTFFYKSVPEKSREVYETVLKANLAAIDKVKAGVKLSDVDKAARKVIEDAGYGKYFTHRTGHFIGLETHDAGDVSSANDTLIEAGNIFSIEPGIYLPGQVGVRIEDLVMATEDGCILLNKFPKDLQIIE